MALADFQLFDVPDQGGIDAVNVPHLLAQAWRDERSGMLTLKHGRGEHRILVRKGSPVTIEAAGAEDGFARFLDDTGRIPSCDRIAIERMARERQCPEASAVLALKLLDAKALYHALRGQVRSRIAETFNWSAGQYHWSGLREEASDAPNTAKPIDLLAMLQEELPQRWGADRLFTELEIVQHVCGDIAPRFRKVAEKLAATGDTAASAVRRLDGSLALGRVLGECAGDPLAAATLWTLLRTGTLRITDGTAKFAAPSALKFDVQVAVAARPTHASTSREKTGPIDAASSENPKSVALSAEIEALKTEFVGLDHYSALGLNEDATAVQLKKAYFKAAKKYHPDALARLGLESLRDDAAQIFARIAEAFETLSDPDKRRAYDASGSEEPEIDTARLAQAETSFRKGEILAKMGNFDGALEYFEPAVELWPDEPAYQAGLGWALYKQPKSDHVLAAHHFELALARAPEDAVILFRFGLVLRAAGKTARANELIETTRSLEPSIEE